MAPDGEQASATTLNRDDNAIEDMNVSSDGAYSATRDQSAADNARRDG